MTPNDFLPRCGRVGETPHEIAQHMSIFLDGVEQRDVISYDCNAGTVERCKTNADGDIYVEPGTDDVAVETLKGVVTVEWKE